MKIHATSFQLKLVVWQILTFLPTPFLVFHYLSKVNIIRPDLHYKCAISSYLQHKKSGVFKSKNTLLFLSFVEIPKRM